MSRNNKKSISECIADWQESSRELKETYSELKSVLGGVE